MTAPTLQSLLTPITAAQWQAYMLGLLTTAEPPFPVTSWPAVSTARQLIVPDCTALADLELSRVALTEGGFLELAAADPALAGWVILWAKSQYDLEPIAQVQTVFSVTGSNTSGNPLTLEVGECQVSYGLKTYTNLDRFTIQTDGTLVDPDTLVLKTVRVQADQGTQGSSGNIFDPTGSPIDLVLLQPTGTTGIGFAIGAYTLLGRDEETPAELAVRCRGSWPGLGGGATEAVYKKWALESTDDPTRVDDSGNVLRVPQGLSLGVTRVYVKLRWDADLATTRNGHVSVFGASDTGPLDAGNQAALLAFIAARAPGCITVHVGTRPEMTVYVTGTMKYSGAVDVAVLQARLGDALAAYALLLPNYASPALDKVYYSLVSNVLQTCDPTIYVADAVRICTTGSPGVADLAITDNGSIVVFDISGLVWALS